MAWDYMSIPGTQIESVLTVQVDSGSHYFPAMSTAVEHVFSQGQHLLQHMGFSTRTGEEWQARDAAISVVARAAVAKDGVRRWP
jgi:hypothetical protein